MDQVTISLNEILRREMSAYALRGYNAAGERSRLYYVESEQDQIYCVVALYDPVYKRADLVIMARIVNGRVIIEHDKTSKPLYDALIHAGVPDNLIVAAWQQNSSPST